MKPLIAVALSGGIDSLVSAHLIKEKGHPVMGLHFSTGFETSGESDTYRGEKLVAALQDQLDIPVHLIDCRAVFKSQVVDYFTDTYMSGQTPNPCMVCNPRIKFGELLTVAHRMGATSLATGHYAKVTHDDHGIYRLFKGVDPVKDQSYFLALLTQAQLSSACFPLAELTKSDVKSYAAKKGLAPITSNESQDICFVTDTTYSDFLMTHVDFKPIPGIIENSNGIELGRHQGLYKFTVGQRRGINCPGPAAYYVLKLDPVRNRLIVGFKEELAVSECQVHKVNWIVPDVLSPMKVHTRIRYRHQAAPSVVIPMDNKMARVSFESPQNAITPGQGAVFYRGDEVLGGGFIAS